MKKAELTKGMRVALSRGRDWQQYNVDEAYVLDADQLYKDFERWYYADKAEATEWDNPLRPGEKVSKKVLKATKGGNVAVLKRAFWGDDDWRVELVPLGQIVGTYEEASGVVEEEAARRKRIAEAARAETANIQRQFAELKAQHPALDDWRVSLRPSGEVRLPLSILRDLLNG